MRISDKGETRSDQLKDQNFRGGSGFIYAAAVVLSGGRGTRAGGAKAFLSVDGCYLIEQVLKKCLALFPDVMVSCRREDAISIEKILGGLPDLSRVIVIPDRVDGPGPLEGISTGLASSRMEWVFVTGCDMPLIQESVIRFMWHRREENKDAVVARIGGHIEPLHAFYRKEVQKAVDHAIARSMHKITSFFPDISPLVIEEEEISHIPGFRRSFTNINTRGDIRKWLEGRFGLN